MTQAVTYLAMAPKSNAVITRLRERRARRCTENGPLPVPLHLRNAPTKLMKSLGYGGGYKYPHDFEGNYVPEEYLPDALVGRRFYEPGDSGAEAQSEAQARGAPRPRRGGRRARERRVARGQVRPRRAAREMARCVETRRNSTRGRWMRRSYEEALGGGFSLEGGARRRPLESLEWRLARARSAQASLGAGDAGRDRLRGLRLALVAPAGKPDHRRRPRARRAAPPARGRGAVPRHLLELGATRSLGERGPLPRVRRSLRHAHVGRPGHRRAGLSRPLPPRAPLRRSVHLGLGGDHLPHRVRLRPADLGRHLQLRRPVQLLRHLRDHACDLERLAPGPPCALGQAHHPCRLGRAGRPRRPDQDGDHLRGGGGSRRVPRHRPPAAHPRPGGRLGLRLRGGGGGVPRRGIPVAGTRLGLPGGAPQRGLQLLHHELDGHPGGRPLPAAPPGLGARLGGGAPRRWLACGGACRSARAPGGRARVGRSSGGTGDHRPGEVLPGGAAAARGRAGLDRPRPEARGGDGARRTLARAPRGVGLRAGSPPADPPPDRRGPLRLLSLAAHPGLRRHRHDPLSRRPERPAPIPPDPGHRRLHRARRRRAGRIPRRAREVLPADERDQDFPRLAPRGSRWPGGGPRPLPEQLSTEHRRRRGARRGGVDLRRRASPHRTTG